MRRRAICSLLLAACLILGWRGFEATCAADDVVTLVPTTPGKPGTQVRGTIIDYSGQTLVIQTSVGQSSIPAAKIDAIQTDLSPNYKEGLQLLATPKSNEAVRALTAAASAESRPWMRREIMAQLTTAYYNSGRIVEAGNTFLNMVHEDPQTIHLDAIPLAWYSFPPNFERDRAARGWMEQSSAPAQLLGASWLLGTSDRAKAIEVLNNLRRNSSPQIALLAEAQLWQTKFVTATADDVALWQRQLSAGIVRGGALAGPTLVIGKAWRQLDNDTKASLVLMRPPILYPTHRAVAAEALLQAGRSLERSGKTDDARRVLTEVIDQYGDQPPRQEAEMMLQRMANSGSN